jgi:glycine betaine catabolism A
LLEAAGLDRPVDSEMTMPSVLEKPAARRSAPTRAAIESGLTPADFAPTLRSLPDARTLPASLYISPEGLRLEQEGLFARMWVCVGREEDIPSAGDYFMHEIAGDSIVIARGSDGVVRAFYNVCRHRGARLLDAQCGKGLSRVVCPYHAWTYRLDGSLAQVPRMEEGFQREGFSLTPVRLGTWAGFIFLNLDDAAEPLEQYLADLPDLTRFKMEDLRVGRRIEYEVAANWKLICENYSECYHCPGVHPQLFRISDHIARHERVPESGACFNGGPMMMRDGYETMSMSGKRTVPIISGLKPEDHRFVYYYVIYPNLLLSPHPDYVLTHTAWPVAPGRTRIVCEFLFTQEALARPDFDPTDMVEFWDVTNRQDWGLCERVQQGARSRGYRPGPYQPSEDCVHTFDRWYAEQMVALL